MSPTRIVALALAVALILVTSLSWNHDRQFSSIAQQAPGVVIGQEVRRSRALLLEEESAHPIIRFTDEEGVEHEFVSSVAGRAVGLASDPAGWVGEELTVEYDPASPERARVLREHQGIGRWLLVGLALMLLVVPRILRVAFADRGAAAGGSE